MVGRRRYNDGCPVAHGLDMLGERWALLVVRELLLGPKRFSDLRAGLPGASADIVAVRLRELEGHGVVERRWLPAPANAWVYELTPWGAALEPIVVAVARWSLRSPEMAQRSDQPLSVASAVLSLRVLFTPAAAEDMSTTIALRVDDEPFEVTVDPHGLGIRRGASPAADAGLSTDPTTLTSLLRGTSSAETERQRGRLDVLGDSDHIEAFLDLFRGPRERSRRPSTPAGTY